LGSDLKVSNDHLHDQELENEGIQCGGSEMCKSCHLKKSLIERYGTHLNCLETIGNEPKWNGILKMLGEN
jgi:hypothetical protein